MSTNAHEEIYRDCKITLQYDDNPDSPRNWDNVGTMVCWHRRYKLGDEQPEIDAYEWFLNHVEGNPKWNPSKENDPELLRQIFDEDNVRLPLYLYDHSGITISTGPFSCPWDSGQVGFIYCPMKRARNIWHGTDEEIREKATACLRAEVETYDAYLTGHVFGYVVYAPNGDEIESVWGFYPDDKGECLDALEQAKDAVDSWHEDLADLETATVGCYI